MSSPHGSKPPFPKTKNNGRKPPLPAPPKPGSRTRRLPPPPPVSTKIHGGRPAPPPKRTGRSECCPMVAAVHALERGQFRLARRYAGWSLRIIAARF